jgi:PAS domain S-box-containing protein
VPRTARSIAARTASANSPGVRMPLLEALLREDDVQGCSEICLRWIGENTDVDRALCAIVGEDGRHVVGVVGLNLPASAVGAFSLETEDVTHPLIRAMNGRKPVAFARGADQLVTPLGHSSVLALPLRGQLDDEEPAGLLLVAGAHALDPDVLWAADILGTKLVKLRNRDIVSAAEKRFERDRTLLTHAINAVTDPIVLTNTEGNLVIANARAERLFTAPDDASEGRRRAVALNNMLFSAALSGESVEQTELARRELLLVDPVNGTDLLFELLSGVVKDPREGTCVVSILRNVTDLGHARAELEENYRKLRVAEVEARADRHRLELIIDSVADPILVTDPEGDIILMNPPAEKLFAQEAAGQGAERALRANDAHFSSFVSTLFTSDSLRHTGELNLIDPANARAVPFEAIAGKVLTEQGELTAVVTILHDRTEAIEKAALFEQVKRAAEELEGKVHAATNELAKQNEQLRRQAIQLEQASAAKSQFLANMSHEFRTPLNAILGYTNMTLRGVSGPVPAPVQKNLVRIDSNGRHLLAIVNDILDITRIEAGRMPLRVEAFEASALVAEVMAELEPIITSKPYPVTTEVPGSLPVLETDRQKVKQIVLNFLSNALKFTSQGSIRLTAGYDEGNGLLSLAVIDTGIGIPEADHEKIFEDFQQVDNSPTRQFGGAGLGLAICRRLSTMIGANITLHSDVGSGSTFTLHIPATAESARAKRRLGN